MKPESIYARKQRLRELCRRAQHAPEDVETSSQTIGERLMEMVEYRKAKTVCTFVSLPTEVQTFLLIRSAWADGKRVAVPRCRNGRIELFHLKSMEELAPRTLGILEPREELLSSAERCVDPGQVELFIVPGLAFDPLGGRLGQGKGYYDRLLARASARVPKIGLALESQIVEAVPMSADDVFMDGVVTECRILRRETTTRRR